MEKAYQETQRSDLKNHVGQIMRFQGFVSKSNIGKKEQKLLVISIKSDNDLKLLLNHVWLTIGKNSAVELFPNQRVSFTALVCEYRRARKFTKDGFADSRDYGLENVHNLMPLPSKEDKIKIIDGNTIKFYKSYKNASEDYGVSVYKLKKLWKVEKIKNELTRD